MLRDYYRSLGLPDDIPNEILDDLIKPKDIQQLESDECEHDFIRMETGHTCQLCGIVDLDHLVFKESSVPVKNHHIYKRNNYFIEKMRLLTGIKQTANPKYIEMIQLFKKKKIKDIYKLKELMKKHGYSKFYKYIWSAYYDITGKKLISISHSDIKKLSYKFLNFERHLKTNLRNRTNFPNYNTIIYLFLKKEGYKDYQHIILPKNQKKIIEIITEIIEK
mgnify:FL=1